ncbi:unnamed protein product, partial [marine sediment metagenome]
SGLNIRTGQTVKCNTFMDKLQVDIKILQLVVQTIENPESPLVG